MRALYKGNLLKAQVAEARGPNLLLVNGILIDPGGAVSVFDRLLIAAADLEVIEFESESEEIMFNQAHEYVEAVSTKQVSTAEKYYEIIFKRPDLPTRARAVDYKVYEYDPFSGEKLQRVIEVGRDYLITQGVNEPRKVCITYEIPGENNSQ